MIKAVFLDRDGVINPLVYNPLTGEYESPHHPEDLSVYPYVIESLRTISGLGYKLFLISNQPSFAKGKTTLENIQAIHAQLDKHFKYNGIEFIEYFYCYHHPQGIMPGYSGECDCRKPKPGFLCKAKAEFTIDMSASWLIGDQDTDVQCAQSQGLRTVLIQNKHSAHKRGSCTPDFSANNLEEAVQILEKL